MRGLNAQIKLLIVIMLCAAACIVRNKHGQVKFFTISSGRQLNEIKFLTPRVHLPQWIIGYRYGVECKPEERQNDAELKEAMTASLQTWLQPLKELKPARPIVDKFVYELQADFNPINPDDRHNPNEPEDLAGWREVDLRVTFQCRQGISVALTGLLFQPAVIMREGSTTITPRMLSIMMHEFGHAFGLGDTYVRAGVMRSHGGLSWTAGEQPASIMARPSLLHHENSRPPTISEDDRRGIIWLYKYFHEGITADNCFFTDYIHVIVEGMHRCAPKHPLIFEAKHNHSTYAVQILKDDPTIDINAQDVSGMTALHYAAIQDKVDVVKALLTHKDIKPFLSDKQGHTALKLAREQGLAQIVALLLSHPLTLSVEAKGKQITTWGAVKQED